MTHILTTIVKTKAEVQSNLDRQRAAEILILQLPETHDGRNTWLLDFGASIEAQQLRVLRAYPAYLNEQYDALCNDDGSCYTSGTGQRYCTTKCTSS